MMQWRILFIPLFYYIVLIASLAPLCHKNYYIIVSAHIRGIMCDNRTNNFNIAH